MKGKAWSIARPSALTIFLLLFALSLSAAPLAAQDGRPNCITESSVFTPAWDPDAEATTTFVMTKNCQTTNTDYFEVKQGKSFTIDGKNFTIYAAAKSAYPTTGTVVGFEDGGERMLTLKNVTIEGGGTETGASRSDNTPDPAIVTTSASLLLDNVTIRNTRGGAIRMIVDPDDSSIVGKITLKNVKLEGNQVSGTGSDTQGAAITMDKGNLVLQNLFTLKTNTGGVGAIHLKAGTTTLDIYDLGCLDVSGNTNAAGTATDIHPALTAELQTLWDGKPTVTDDSCDGTTASTTPRPTPTPAGGGGNGGSSGSGDGMPMPSLSEDGRIGGMIGSGSAYFLINRGGVMVLRIYRVDSDSVGHWVMDVAQTAVDAASAPACVAASPDGRYAVRVWADGNVTVSDGPDMESKVFHNTLRGGLTPAVISTDTTYSSTPPGVGCPGYVG